MPGIFIDARRTRYLYRAAGMSSAPDTSTPPKSEGSWIKAIIVITTVMWLAAIGMMFLTYQMQQNAVYQSSVIANPLSVGLAGGAISRPQHITQMQATIVLVALTLLIGLPLLYVRKRVSLLSLLLLMIFAGAVGVVPRFLLNDAPMGGVITLREQERAADQQLSDADFGTLRIALEPEFAFSRLPETGREMGISPDMIESVEVTREYATATGQGFIVFINFKPGLTSEQSGTIFHFYSELLRVTASMFYGEKLPPTLRLEAEGGGLDARAINSRFDKYAKQWRKNLGEAAPKKDAPEAPAQSTPPPSKEF
jgi:hypothetical protein